MLVCYRRVGEMHLAKLTEEELQRMIDDSGRDG